MIQPARINDPVKLDRSFIKAELTAGREIIIQFSSASYNSDMLAELNDYCRKFGDNFSIRFYGHYSGSFDCRTVFQIPDTKCLFVDCLEKADHIEALTTLAHLKKFSLGVYGLKDTEILGAPNFRQLHQLGMLATKTKALNLDHLRHYVNLQSLSIAGHSKNMEAIGELSRLATLYLCGISRTPATFVNKLRQLRTLHFILGGRDNIHEIDENEIESLEIVWVRGFNDLGNISKFRKIRKLKIQDQKQLPNIHFDAPLPDLQNLTIFNCKTLNDISGLSNLPALTSLFISLTNIDYNQFLRQEFPPSLKQLRYFTGSKRRNSEVNRILEERGFNKVELRD